MPDSIFWQQATFTTHAILLAAVAVLIVLVVVDIAHGGLRGVE